MMNGSMRTGKTEEPDTSALHLLHRATQCMEDLFHVATSGLDITPRQFLLLKHIAKREGLSQTDLVKCTGIDRSTMADIVRRLVKKRYVQRRRTTNDARAYMIGLTSEGRAALDEAKSIADRVDKEFLSALPTQRAQDLLTNLLSVVQALRPL
jgi:MarR family transcriptional regulator, temperature-dependent positive regulator of motility